MVSTSIEYCDHQPNQFHTASRGWQILIFEKAYVEQVVFGDDLNRNLIYSFNKYSECRIFLGCFPWTNTGGAVCAQIQTHT